MASSTTLIDQIQTAQSQKEITLNALIAAASPALTYGRHASACSGLTFAGYGGTVLVGATPTEIANWSLTLTASTTCYIRKLDVTGAVSFTTSLPTDWPNAYSGYTALFTVVTGASTVTSYIDHRVSTGAPGEDGVGAGSVTSVGITAPAAGITSSGGPITASGNITLALADDLSALEGLTGTGFAKRTAADTWSVGDALNLSGAEATGTLAAARMPALTGDITSSAGAVATTLANNAVTNAKAAQMAAHTLKGNNTGSTANAIDLTATQATAELNVVVGDSGAGGTKGLVPAPASGDAAAGKYLKADGTFAVPPGSGAVSVTGTGFVHITSGSQDGAARAVDVSSADVTGALAAARFPALTGDVTTVAGAVATTIATNAVTNAKAAQMAAHTLKGNNSGSTANAADLTATQVTAELDAMVGDSGAGGTKGLVPAPASGDAAAGKYLKADGTFAVPPGTGGATDYATYMAGTGAPPQPSFFLKHVRYAQWIGAIAAPSQFGFAFPAAGAVSPVSTNLRTSVTGSRVATTSSAGNNATIAAANQCFWTGNAAELGGFLVSVTFGLDTVNAGMRFAAGLAPSALDFGSSQPSATASMVFVGCDAADSNLQVMHNDASGTATKIDLGSNFPGKTANAVYKATFFCAPNTTTIYYRVDRVDSPFTATGSFSSDIPSNTTFLDVRICISNAAVATIVALHVMTVYGETPI